MRVLLTGANGFIGSHILDRLVESGSEVAILLRRTGDTRFIEARLPRVDIRYGSLDSTESLREAFRDAEVIIHCAGKTKAVRKKDYYAVNAEGARRVVEACNALSDSVAQLILISSLAVSGPGSVESPAREDAPPRPVSTYGKSKMLGEQYVRRQSRVPYTILRPSAVYGPRDRDFYLAFRMARRKLLPLIGGGRQALSLIYAADVAEGVLRSIGNSASHGNTYHLAHAVPWTQRALLAKMAEAMGTRPLRFGVPAAVLYPACLLRDLWSRVTGRPSILTLEKVPEYRAPGWVCATDRAAEDLGFVAGTSLDEGIKLTLKWYTEQRWL
ncbi:MAG: NAD-dependent epimerase/dehydratase family protein [Candidatus Brocadiae bacterium]|nr:NAD-dependent epimerase/dehydratase family protein [Candidatus Brocadiia bacterium]